jgi:predicted RNase H-like HicB family nuclease
VKRYLVLVEQAADGSWSAYVPDLPGCVAGGFESPREAQQAIAEALDLHLKGILEDGDPVPEPRTVAQYVETSIA